MKNTLKENLLKKNRTKKPKKTHPPKLEPKVCSNPECPGSQDCYKFDKLKLQVSQIKSELSQIKSRLSKAAEDYYKNKVSDLKWFIAIVIAIVLSFTGIIVAIIITYSNANDSPVPINNRQKPGHNRPLPKKDNHKPQDIPDHLEKDSISSDFKTIFVSDHKSGKLESAINPEESPLLKNISKKAYNNITNNITVNNEPYLDSIVAVKSSPSLALNEISIPIKQLSIRTNSQSLFGDISEIKTGNTECLSHKNVYIFANWIIKGPYFYDSTKIAGLAISEHSQNKSKAQLEAIRNLKYGIKDYLYNHNIETQKTITYIDVESYIKFSDYCGKNYYYLICILKISDLEKLLGFSQKPYIADSIKQQINRGKSN